jgi:MFS family permease
MSSSQLIPDSVISTDELAIHKRHLPAVFRWLWCGQFISLMGSQLSLVSFQLIAVTALHAGAMAMGILTASQTAPYLLFGLFVGVLVDRRSRFAILMAADLLRAVIILAAAMAAGYGQLSIWLLCITVSLISVLNLIFDAALSAHLTEILHRKVWLVANSRLSVTTSGSELGGPVLAGYIVQLLSAAIAMVIDSGSYFVSAGCLLLSNRSNRDRDGLRHHLERRGIDSGVDRENLLSSVKAGVQLVAKHPILRIFALWSAIWNFSWSAVLSVFVLHASRTLLLKPALIGFVMAAGGMGGMLGGATGNALASRWTRGKVLVYAPMIAAFGGSFLLLPKRTFSLEIAALAMFLFNAGQSAFGVNMQTCRQEVTPAQLMGRMDTTMRLCFTGMASLGALSGGFLASRCGVLVTLAVGICGLFLVVYGLKHSPLEKLVDSPQRQAIQ